MQRFVFVLILLGLLLLRALPGFAFNPNPMMRPMIYQVGGPTGDPSYDFLYHYCRGQGIVDEGCNLETLRPIQWRYRYYYPQAQVGECKYMCAYNQYCQGVYKPTPIGYLCGEQ
jgi:hypothetical protein